MQIKNNYQTEWEKKSKYGVTYDAGSGVFNGDTGIITEINTFMEQMTVKFDDERIVKYDFKQLEELELAYAITVHKSQGSEYPAVVIPMYPGPRMLMNKNLLYTLILSSYISSRISFESLSSNLCRNEFLSNLF